MGLAASNAAFLQNQGYNAVHLRDQGLQRLPDLDIITKARAENRVILTHDLDFSRIVALSGSHRPSVITFRLNDMRPGQVNHYLSQVLTRFSNSLEEGALVSVNEQAIRVRLLPIETA